MQQYSKNFVKLLEVFRAESDDSPLDFALFSRKSAFLVDVLQENAIKTLSSQEFLREVYFQASFDRKSKKFFVPFAENLKNTQSPMQAVRNLVKKNEFIQFPSLTASFSEKKLNKTSNSREKTAVFFESDEKFNENSLKITKPAYITSKIKVFEPKIPQKRRVFSKKASLPGLFAEEKRTNCRDFVLSHAKGFKNPENRDFFKHLLRLFARNQAILSQKPAKTRFFAENAQFSQEKASKLAIKTLCLEKYARNFAVFEKILEKVAENRVLFEENDRSQGKIVTFSAEVLSMPNIRRFWHEEVFLMNILEKVSSFGVRSLKQAEISSFQDILLRRTRILGEVSQEIREKAKKNQHFSTVYEELREVSEEKRESCAEYRGNPKKKRRMSETLAYFATNSMNSSVETRNFAENPARSAKKREKLKPLTMISQKIAKNSPENCENLEFRLEIAKKKLFLREEFADLPEKWLETAENRDFLGLWNRPSRRNRKKSVSSEKNAKIRENFAVSAKKVAEKSEATKSFNVFSSKLLEKARSFKENDEKKQVFKEIFAEKLKETEILEEESEGKSTPLQSKRESLKKYQISIEKTQKINIREENNGDFKEIARNSEKNREIIEKLKPLFEKNGEKLEESIKKPEKQGKKPSVFKEKAEIVVDYTKTLKKLMKMPESRENHAKKASFFARSKETEQNPAENAEVHENTKKLSTLSINTSKSPAHSLFLAKKSSFLPETQANFENSEATQLKSEVPPHKSVVAPQLRKSVAPPVPAHKSVAPPLHKSEVPTHKLEVPTHKSEVPTHKLEVPAHKSEVPAHKSEATRVNSEATPKTLEDNAILKKSSVFSQVSRKKTSSFSKFSVIKLKNSKKTRTNTVISQLFHEEAEDPQAENLGNFKETAIFPAETQENREESEKLDDLDAFLSKDMAFLDKKAIKMQQILSKNSVFGLSNQNSLELATPKSNNFEILSAKNSLKDAKIPPKIAVSPSHRSKLKDPPALAREKSGEPAPNNESSSSFSIEDADFREEWAENDPLFRRDSREKPLKLTAFEEIPTKNTAVTSKHGKKAEKLAFAWEDSEKVAGNSFETAGLVRESKEFSKKTKENEARPSILLTPSIITPTIASFKKVLRKDEAISEKKSENNENPNENEAFFLNPTPLLKKPGRKPAKEQAENPYESLKVLHQEADLSKKHKQSRSFSKKDDELTDSVSSGDLNLLDLMRHELKKSENLKLGDLKQGIEENMNKIAEDTDEEAKFHMMLYANRKEQLQKYIELASENQQNWLSQPDCTEQLRTFLLEKNKNFNDYEKNSALKFCSPIQLPKNEALQTIINKSGNSLGFNAEQHEKFVEFMMKINEEAFQERERRKKFRTERQMLRALREFLARKKGKVLQKGLKEEEKFVKEIAETGGLIRENRGIGVKMEENSKENDGGKEECKKMEEFAQKIKRLKRENRGKFDELLTKMKKVKQCEYVFY